MHCLRCRGLMVPDDLFEHGTSGHLVWRRSRRCMNCGDGGGIEYARGRDTPQAVAFSSEPDYHDEEVHLGKESYLAPM